MNIIIKHQFSGAVLFETDAPDMATALTRALVAGLSAETLRTKRALYAVRQDAVRQDAASQRWVTALDHELVCPSKPVDLRGADLGGADLGGADLQGADLHGADLCGAYLRGADLGGTNLRGAVLRGAYLHGAYLQGANLRGADLQGANLHGADLGGADLQGADLQGADLGGADLGGAYLSEAKGLPSHIAATDPPEPYVRKPAAELLAESAARYRAAHPEVPVVPHLDARILAAITAEGGQLEMSQWHTCETTHCRAGWAIHLAGEAGRILEERFDSEPAGAMIYRASTGRVPYFFATNEEAIADIRRCAEQDPLPSRKD